MQDGVGAFIHADRPIGRVDAGGLPHTVKPAVGGRAEESTP